MELASVAQFFDKQPVLDAYSGAVLFYGQPDVYDGTERDSETGWRRSLSSAGATLPARGVVRLGTEYYLVGRSIDDYFAGSRVRQHLLLHPADGACQYGSAANFINSTSLTTCYGAIALRKEQKEEEVSSRLFTLAAIYVAESETVSRDHIVRHPNGRYYRVQNTEVGSGGIQILTCTDLGAEALVSATYTSVGEYSVESDTSAASAPKTIQGFFERFQTNYLYLVDANIDFTRADKVLTVTTASVAAPAPGDVAAVSGVSYRVLERRAADVSTWALHVRRAP